MKREKNERMNQLEDENRRETVKEGRSEMISKERNYSMTFNAIIYSGRWKTIIEGKRRRKRKREGRNRREKRRKKRG